MLVLRKSKPVGMNYCRYHIQEDSGVGANPYRLAYFDTLEDAAMVLRYLKGGYMPKEDQEIALNLIQKWDQREQNDAVTEESESPSSVANATN